MLLAVLCLNKYLRCAMMSAICRYGIVFFVPLLKEYLFCEKVSEICCLIDQDSRQAMVFAAPRLTEYYCSVVGICHVTGRDSCSVMVSHVHCLPWHELCGRGEATTLCCRNLPYDQRMVGIINEPSENFRKLTGCLSSWQSPYSNI